MGGGRDGGGEVEVQMHVHLSPCYLRYVGSLQVCPSPRDSPLPPPPLPQPTPCNLTRYESRYGRNGGGGGGRVREEGGEGAGGKGVEMNMHLPPFYLSSVASLQVRHTGECPPPPPRGITRGPVRVGG